ncbi:MAG TPA: MarR family transcriptional regulator [Acidimicrobiia bacterium]|nr:MarR family transcriptional regulator [Acidimicrobiia bacterium]
MNNRVADGGYAAASRAEQESVEGPRFSYAVGVLDRSIRRSLGAVLRLFELTVAEYTALSLISRRDGYSNAELARRSFVSPQAMHEMISSLEGRGLLERAPSRSHRSIRHTHLTDKGRDLLERCNVAVDEMEEEMLAGVSPGRRAEMINILRECARNLRGFPPPD